MPSFRYSAAVRLILICLLVLLPAVSQAGQRGPQLTGTVVDASGAPISGGPASILAASGSLIRAAASWKLRKNWKNFFYPIVRNDVSLA